MPAHAEPSSSSISEDIVLVEKDTHDDDEDENAPLLGGSAQEATGEDRNADRAEREVDEEEDEEEEETRRVSRFDQPTPSPWKRVALLLFIGFLFWLAYNIRGQRNKKPEIIYASRYSKEHKYRPAASPIITETLKDGRIRLRGATPPPPSPTPTPTKSAMKRRRSKKGTSAGKKKARVNKRKARKN